MKTPETKVLKEHLNFEEREVRKHFINNYESSLYGGKDKDGKPVSVLLEKGEGMTVRYISKETPRVIWFDVFEYDANGFQTDQYLEHSHKD